MIDNRTGVHAPVDTDKVEPALAVEPPDEAVEDALFEVPLEPRVVVVDDLGLAAQLVLVVGADDHAEAVAEGLHAALAVAEVVVEHARDEVAVLELDLTPPLELAVAVLASLEP